MATFLWFVFAAIYLPVLITLGLATLRKGHVFLFFIGIIFPAGMADLFLGDMRRQTASLEPLERPWPWRRTDDGVSFRR